MYAEGLPMNVSVDMSIAFLSKAKLGVSFFNLYLEHLFVAKII